ncbi:hypothetical protein [Ralstonia pseudosolanacearum]|uniref:hypothetical protein n=1 Tax=Ralstonia pseudosolanacearum TaxID=1310165 RepID=UPI001FF8EF54|nr:hypothetical protein [Ralstonia pseudosolanacearum]
MSKVQTSWEQLEAIAAERRVVLAQLDAALSQVADLTRQAMRLHDQACWEAIHESERPAIRPTLTMAPVVLMWVQRALYARTDGHMGRYVGVGGPRGAATYPSLDKLAEQVDQFVREGCAHKEQA